MLASAGPRAGNVTRRTWYTTRPASAGLADERNVEHDCPPRSARRAAARPSMGDQDRRERRVAVPAAAPESRAALGDDAARVVRAGWPARWRCIVILLVSTWRWRLLLQRPAPAACRSVRCSRRTWSRCSSTTFCRRTSAAMSFASATRRGKPGSKTLAATVVLVDRGIGLLGLVFVAALGSTMAARVSEKLGPVGPGILWTLLGGAIAAAACRGRDAAGRGHDPAPAEDAAPGVGRGADRAADGRPVEVP